MSMEIPPLKWQYIGGRGRKYGTISSYSVVILITTEQTEKQYYLNGRRYENSFIKKKLHSKTLSQKCFENYRTNIKHRLEEYNAGDVMV